MKNATRPYIICHMTSGIDGKIKPTLWPTRLKIHSHYEKCHDKLNGDGWIIGRTSMQGFASKKIKSLGKSDRSISKNEDFVGDSKAKSYAIVIDQAGKCRWDSNDITGDHVIEILTEKVSTAYLKHLREKGVSYIFAGHTVIDLPKAVKKLRALFGIKRLLLEGGGIINGSFLKAGLIDEVSLLVMPIIDGSIGTPTVFDAEEGYTKRKATQLNLKSINKLSGGVLWLRYNVAKLK